MTQARDGAIDGAIFGPEHALGRVGPGKGREEGFGMYGVCGRAARSHQEGLVCALHRLAISDHREMCPIYLLCACVCVCVWANIHGFVG